MEAAQAKPVHDTIAPQRAERKQLRVRLFHRIEQACQLWCVFGGIILVVAVGIILASILGRFLAGLGIGPGSIVGDNELMEAACVIAAFAFLPWCQLKRGHVAVDILVARLGPRAGLLASAISDMGMLAVAVLIAWRLFANLLEKHAYGETTMLLDIPTSLIYALSFVGCIFFVLACFVTLANNLGALTTRPRYKNIMRSN
ncbi:TRAP transporter small permease [Pusillimonas noertemannii]|uniref:TRAP transporter small permease n=1 Tax=Pusillimonas noertemannii TaxID=305977 RepID=UPI00037A7DD6|nr:TRAP transporter small permease [Pusillimonas noertemannii]